MSATDEKPATPATTPAAPAAATPAAKPAPKPRPAPKPKPGEASPRQARPGVIYGGVKALKTPNVVVEHEHVASAGETFASIARIYYGDGRQADRIRSANPTIAGEPEPGQSIRVPKG